MSDTIFALSSGALPSGVAIVRISGPNAFDIASSFVGDLPLKRGMYLRPFISRSDYSRLDEGLVLTFPAPNSFTGENIVELQLHGSQPLVAKVLQELGSVESARHAQAGEFSRRAFENAKMDLTQIEGLADLLVAKTEEQRRVASSQHAGALREKFEQWRLDLLNIRALMEAEIDFADEDDVPDDMSDGIKSQLEKLIQELNLFLAGRKSSEIIRDGLNIAIIGPPNSGKSTLLNALAKRPAAIVTDIEGTTRDIVTVELEISGVPVYLHDTAGIRQTEDVVENIGIERSKDAFANADLVLSLSSDGNFISGTTQASILKIVTKNDLREARRIKSADADMDLCALNEEDISALEERLAKLTSDKFENSDILSTRQRHYDCVAQCIGILSSINNSSDYDHGISAENMRLAADCIGRITGRIDVENILDVIFKDFCVGK